MLLAILLYSMAISLLLAPAGAKLLRDPHGTRSHNSIVPHHPHFSLRILPLGASITWGQYSTDGNGYREHLRGLLEKRSSTVDMVGTVHSGAMSDNENEGHPGARVDQVALFAEHDLLFQPNLILINAGTNDVLHEAPDYPIDKIGERMNKLIDRLFFKIPNVTVILSTLIINTHAGADERIQKIVNPQYEALVKRKQKGKARIVLADLYQVLEVGELIDGTHPSDEGYEKIAEAWLKAIAEAGLKGLLVEPQDMGNPNVNRPPDVIPTTHNTVAPFALATMHWSTERANFSTTPKVHNILPTAHSTATPTKSFYTPQVSCSASQDQGPVGIEPPPVCPALGKAPAYISQTLSSAMPKSNAVRSNEHLWSGWWL